MMKEVASGGDGGATRAVVLKMRCCLRPLHSKLLGRGSAWRRAIGCVCLAAAAATALLVLSRITSDTIHLPVPTCRCSKVVPAPAKADDGSYRVKHSTCSPEAFLRGAGQKVVAFTFYEAEPGDDGDENRKVRAYLQGVSENLKLVKKLYPGYIMRLYFEVLDQGSSTMKELCRIACAEPNFDLCDPGLNPKLGRASTLFPLFWRFLPAIDRQVDIFFSRDLDSRISDREVACVEEFAGSDYKVHVMRDHPGHSTSMMGGLWGAKVDQVRRDLMLSFRSMFKDGTAYVNRSTGFGLDQHALARYIWPWAKKVAMAHTSYPCKHFSNTFPFPTRRLPAGQVGNYVGSIVALNATLGSDVPDCPVKCRPLEHKDWPMC